MSKVSMSNHAVVSVVAALASNEKTEAEKAYDAAEETAVGIPGGHVEKPGWVISGGHGAHGDPMRLYSLTTIASSGRFGGTRTVMICDSFERAHEALTKGADFWWEHSYMFAVIEAFYANSPYGGLCGARDQYWFRFTWDKGAEPGVYPNGRYEAIEKPLFFKNSGVGEFAVG